MAPPVPCTSPTTPAGLKFFPGYLSDARREAIDETALAVQSLGYTQLRQLNPSAFAPPLLPAPDGALPAAVPAAPAGGAVLAVPPTDQRRAAGALHVCEHAECRLPAERWWESNGSSNGKGGKGGKSLCRTTSAPL